MKSMTKIAEQKNPQAPETLRDNIYGFLGV